MRSRSVAIAAGIGWFTSAIPFSVPFSVPLSFPLSTTGAAIAELADDEAERLEQAASTSLDRALNQLVAALAGTDSQRLGDVRGIVRDQLDYASFSRFVLANDHARFDAAQLDRYGCEFHRYLTNYIASRLMRYQQEQISVVRATALPSRDVVVRTRVSGGNFDGAIVTFLLREYRGGQWRVLDVSFDGTKVRRLLRAQFESVLRQGGPEMLIAMLREKTPGTSRCGAVAEPPAPDAPVDPEISHPGRDVPAQTAA